jgi:hypothetical protein
MVWASKGPQQLKGWQKLTCHDGRTALCYKGVLLWDILVPEHYL